MEAGTIARESGNGYLYAVDSAAQAEVETGVLRVAGADRAKWLHKIVTADIEHLEFGMGRRAALLDAKGHFVADFTVLVLDNSLLLLTGKSAVEKLHDNLRRYVFREKVRLTDETRDWRLFTLVGPRGDALATQVFGQTAPESAFSFARAASQSVESLLIRAVRARVPALDILVASAARERVQAALQEIPTLDREALDVLRIEVGLPEWGLDFDTKTLALEIPPEVHGIRIDQGCYVGQEVVARLVHRGHVNRMLAGFKFEGEGLVAHGAVVHDEGKEIGFITSWAASPRFGMIGLGYVSRLKSEIGTRLQVGDRHHAQIVKIPFEE